MSAVAPDAGPWRWEVYEGSAAELHDRPWPEPLVRTVWDLRVTRPALVLGSTQDEAIIDGTAATAAGLDVVRRRSGGGVVRLDPLASVWLDVFVPRDDRWWVDDVSRSARWLGEVWRDALAGLGTAGEVHVGPMDDGRFGRLVCFAGVGPGEVVVRTDGGAVAKVVGISQRRTRAGARLQCQAYVGHDAVLGLDEVLAVDALGAPRSALHVELATVMVPVPVPPEDLRAAVARELTTR